MSLAGDGMMLQFCSGRVSTNKILFKWSVFHLFRLFKNTGALFAVALNPVV